MSSNTTAKVTVTEKIRELRTGNKRFMVRWKVDGAAEKTACFTTAKAARAHQARLIAAVSAGVLFDRDTREPVTWATADHGPSVAEYAQAWLARRWATWKPRTRRSKVEEVAAWLAALGSRPVADREVVYRMLKTMLHPTEVRRATPAQRDLWRRLVSVSRPVGSLHPDQMDDALTACRTQLDGAPAAANYYRRRRATLAQLLKEAVASKLLDTSPLASKKDPTAIRPSIKVDTAEIGEPQQVMAVLEQVGRRSAKWKILFALMYYAGLRPSEAVMVRWADLGHLPTTGWGTLQLRRSAAEAGCTYTDTGTARQEGGLKWRRDGETRTVPLPPVLVTLLRDYRTARARARDLVCPGRGGAPVSSTTVQREWKLARDAALHKVQQDDENQEDQEDPEDQEGADDGLEDQQTQCLHRPYSLRHSAASLWLGLGVGPADVAARLGHSTEELLRTYANVLQSHRDNANSSIAAALDEAIANQATPGPDETNEQKIARLEAELAAARAAQLAAGSPTRPAA